MKKIKILQFPIANARGGITQYALQNWRFIDKSRFQFDFATRSKTLDFADELTDQGCKIHYLTCSSEENESQFIKEVNEILDEGYDAVHLHTSFWKGYLVEKLAMERKCPLVIVHSHSTMIDVLDEQQRKEYIKKHNFYKNRLPLEYATDFCACSKLAAEWLYGEQIPKNSIHILKNAIDVPTYSFCPESRKDYREKLGLNGCFVLGHIGRFVYQKNHDMLIEIFRKVYEKMPNARLMFIGGGKLEKQIQQKVKEYGLENVVMFMGKRTDVSQLLQAMDVFLLPSRFEGLPIVLIEAQVAGLKCFASESISTEAKITPNLEYISDSTSDWVEWIVKTGRGYERIKNDHLITQVGYDLREHIKVIEKLYAGEDISKYCPSAEDEISL
ncbi:MAG: glycosyltransferase [Anaeromicrobium sp.]|jgi:glycosyltransferase involved in cell wall biosynthesis|uniref:glycosyltransferase n=1 Tax=Anaeromicrobium sp. TaxID=1929132 RepID=UPI0025DC94FA|nr:glycosyltransferase [Anaeromicrobium sp.]MCT4592689.1 glycosyltransferase [Anaeromicrobium sp.]